MIRSFLKAAGEFFSPSSPARQEQLVAILSANYKEYLTSKSLMFAEDQRNLGHNISDERVHEILNSSDHFYSRQTTLLKFAEESFSNAQIALIAVRETIREDLGIGLPRMSVSQLKNLDVRKVEL